MQIAAREAAQVFGALEGRPAGLTSEEVAARRAQYGVNRVPEAPGPSLLLRLGSQFVHLFALLLWAGGFLAFLAGLPELGGAIVAVIVINAIFSFWQEYRAERAVAALRRLLPGRAKVRRGGVVEEVLAEELVPGDLLLLAEGDRISADARLVEPWDLLFLLLPGPLLLLAEELRKLVARRAEASHRTQ
ncbi:MAG: hypothetical protein HYY02_09390 [Chloroflexi bacterium]|nr:hypothetical protein [Chloroflexota bacterium]